MGIRLDIVLVFSNTASILYLEHIRVDTGPLVTFNVQLSFLLRNMTVTSVVERFIVDRC